MRNKYTTHTLVFNTPTLTSLNQVTTVIHAQLRQYVKKNTDRIYKLGSLPRLSDRSLNRTIFDLNGYYYEDRGLTKIMLERLEGVPGYLVMVL